MTNPKVGKYLLSFVLATQAILGFALDWEPNHLLNPAWHPHARFHGGLLLFLLAGVSGTGLWLVWREPKDARAARKAAALLALSFWTPFLYVGAIVPGATPGARLAGSVPSSTVYGLHPHPPV